MAGSHEIAPSVHNGVSTLDEPSAAWGWHDIGQHAIQLSGWISVFFLLAYNFGNHEGHVETIYLFAFAILIAVGLLIQLFKPSFGKQQRTLTAHNKPLGHHEPDWAYLQSTVSGPYAKLNDAELRALNIEPSRVAHLREIERENEKA
ncbi:DUF2631 domain-containing protein [Corynebacterium pseudopelargi]|uniref:DUF2631 domain-containing protein n=1 Tax=Corynebacterium pseudopelargi TaxID=2080757 RepID=A0A3G6ITI4_9CORY|nr:DUF2631 domain-containing protein [Corynebacterium pseudopelargi]AZA09019.1 hypothetical protein CPPEL_04460 [Corynebacterium pseudopelargi]